MLGILFVFTPEKRRKQHLCARAVRHRTATVYGVRLARGGTAWRRSPPATSRFLQRPTLPPTAPHSVPLGARPSVAIKPFAARQSVYDTASRPLACPCAHLWKRHEFSVPVRRRPVRRRPVNNCRVRRLVHERCPRRFRAL